MPAGSPASPANQRHRRTSATQASVRRGRFTGEGDPHEPARPVAHLGSATGTLVGRSGLSAGLGVEVIACKSGTSAGTCVRLLSHTWGRSGMSVRLGGRKSSSARVAQVRATVCVQAWLKSRCLLMTAVRRHQQAVAYRSLRCVFSVAWPTPMGGGIPIA